MTLEGTLPVMDHQGRVTRARQRFADAAIDALVVSNLVNVRYLTGFTGSNGVVVLSDEQVVLVTDGRYRDQAARELAEAGLDAQLVIENIDADGALAAAVAGHRRVGLESATVSWDAQRRYAARFAEAALVAVTNLVEGCRAVKDAGELAVMAHAAEIADEALTEVIGRLTQEPTEREFALELELAMRRLGASGPSFETIVASGPNGALPHARPTDRRIVRGDLVVLDFGALVGGYHSDMTRTVCVGPPTPAQRHHYDVVRAAQAAGRDAVSAGVVTKDIDAVCRQVIGDAGWADAFSHGTGHGIGLQVHEMPLLSRTTTAVLEVDYVVTVEPGVYLVDQGGVRVEDTVVVEAGGCRSLTRFPKELEV